MTSSVSTTTKQQKTFTNFNNVYNTQLSSQPKHQPQPNLTQLQLKHHQQSQLQLQQHTQQHVHHFSTQNGNYFNPNFVYPPHSKFNQSDFYSSQLYHPFSHTPFQAAQNISATQSLEDDKQMSQSTDLSDPLFFCIKEESSHSLPAADQPRLLTRMDSQTSQPGEHPSSQAVDEKECHSSERLP